MKLAQENWGLRMDAAGRVAQRSFRDVVKQQLERDGARGILSPLTVEQPLTIVLGADGTGVGKRGIMHVGSSIAPSYKEGIAQQNERNLNTVATSVTDDHWGGLDETLCAGYYTGKIDELPEFCIAAEVDRINADGHIDGVPAKAVGCFDLVAARGIRGGRGRCACHAEAATAEERFSVPDLNGCESDDEIIGKLEAVALLKNSEMRDDSHTPPADWDYEAQGAWSCGRAGCDVKFTCNSDYTSYRDAFLAAKADKTPAGKKQATARATAYGKLHPTGQSECEPPLLGLDRHGRHLDRSSALLVAELTYPK